MVKNWLKYRYLLSLSVLAIYYTVGMVMLVQGGKESGLIDLTPFTIIITSVLLLLNHEFWTKSIVLTLFLIAILGLSIEIIGVNFGIPFGDYSYSSVLGIKLFETPILIGLNWLMLVYSMVMVIHRFVKSIWLKAIIAGIALVGLDILIEPVAINWNMWTWKKSDVPIQNYLTWGVVAFILSLILSYRLKTNNKNRIALWVILCQVVFFVILGLWS